MGHLRTMRRAIIREKYGLGILRRVYRIEGLYLFGYKIPIDKIPETLEKYVPEMD